MIHSVVTAAAVVLLLVHIVVAVVKTITVGISIAVSVLVGLMQHYRIHLVIVCCSESLLHVGRNYVIIITIIVSVVFSVLIISCSSDSSGN